MDADAEDTVFYALFPDFVASEARPSPSDVLQSLEDVRRSCLEVAAPLVQGYVWQHGHFDLQAAMSPPPSHAERTADDGGSSTGAAATSQAVPLIFGQTRYGHNVEDAWFVVYLLFQISRRLPELSIRVWDTDGELLLIEAAYEIPRWLESETSRNRVFIKQGSVHILPLPSSGATETGFNLANPSLLDALKVLASGRVQTKASEAVQRTIARRIAGYPEAARKSMHRVKCRIPVRVAQVLKYEPQMVALAVEAFYRRYHDDMVAASKMEKFLTKNADGEAEMVTVMVTMSRAMYAQLKLQVFQAPKVYPMPPLQAQKLEDEIGMKLACGFEMMYAERSRFQEEEEQSTSGSLSSDVGWQAFRKRLEDVGYFRNLLEGSREYRELIEAAAARYRQTESFARVREAMQAPVKRVDEVLAMEYSVGDFPAVAAENDDDLWLYRGEEELNSAMDEYEKERVTKAKGKNEAATGEELASKMKAFVDKTSSFEGAEVPGEEVDVDLRKLLGELKSVLGETGLGGGEEAEDAEMESDFGDEEGEFDEDEEMIEMETGEAEEASSSRKGKQVFMEEYSEVMEQELKKSSIAKSFAAKDEAGNAAAAPATGAVMPVDVDFNLVKSLLESYSSQQGLPGPASNVLGLMGLQLPDDERPKTKPR